jgi:glycerol-3-phosphate dehydrogenase
MRRDLRGAFVTVDGSLEDDARLVVALARTAASYGARIVTHCRALQVQRDGARIRDELTGAEHDVRARCVVVATGVWSAGLVAGIPLQPSKGAHVLVRAEALGHPTSGFNILVPGSRNRFVFAVPRPDGTVQIGLTDETVDEVEDEPTVSPADERFLLETLSSGLASPLTADAVVGRFAGLRPLLGSASGASAADLSRRHALLDRDGVLVLVGGKLTTYRRMAQDAVDMVVRRLGRDAGCVTTRVPLVGAAGRAGDVPDRLARRFGGEAADVADSGPLEPVVAGAPALRCEVEWALAAEGAVTADDVDRRLRFDLVPSWSAAARAYVDERLDSRSP